MLRGKIRAWQQGAFVPARELFVRLDNRVLGKKIVPETALQSVKELAKKILEDEMHSTGLSKGKAVKKLAKEGITPTRQFVINGKIILLRYNYANRKFYLWSPTREHKKFDLEYRKRFVRRAWLYTKAPQWKIAERAGTTRRQVHRIVKGKVKRKYPLKTGAKVGTARKRLTPAQKAEIWRLRQEDKFSEGKLAKKFSVSQPAIHNILSGKTAH